MLKNIEHLHQQQQQKFCVCKYKMVDIDSNTWNKTGISVKHVPENDNVNKTLLRLLCICRQSKIV